MKIAIVGSTGFVGSEVKKVLESQGHEVRPVRAPRVDVRCITTTIDSYSEDLDGLSKALSGCEAVITCSGNPNASEKNRDVLTAANSISPAIVALAASRSCSARLVHVSTAAVQGRKPCLDETTFTEEFSAYAHSKAEGERLVRSAFPKAVVYRPPSVHAEDRRVTAMIAKIGGSFLASVAKNGDQHSPQALLGNVASAIAFLATTEQHPPPIVIHPWEGLTTNDVMELLGGKPPRQIPRGLARAFCQTLASIGTIIPSLAADARRVEMLWFGQDQADSWLTNAGWQPTYGREAWRSLGQAIRNQ